VPKANNPDSAAIYLNTRATQNRYRLWANAQSKVYNYNYGALLGVR
jgi:iron complex outermembrane receptor protein